MIVLTGSGAALNQRAYPYTPAGGAGDPITSAPLYSNGILAVGTTTGKLFFIDRNNGATRRRRSFASTTSAPTERCPASGTTPPSTATWSRPPTRPPRTGGSTTSTSSPIRRRPACDAMTRPTIHSASSTAAACSLAGAVAARRAAAARAEDWATPGLDAAARAALGRALGRELHRRPLDGRRPATAARACQPGGRRRLRRSRSISTGPCARAPADGGRWPGSVTLGAAVQGTPAVRAGACSCRRWGTSWWRCGSPTGKRSGRTTSAA